MSRVNKSQAKIQKQSPVVIPSPSTALRVNLSRGISKSAGAKLGSSARGLTQNDKRGLVMCNIGAGKGKTTAAMGTCVRAAGAGMNVYIMQFVKAKKKDDADHRGEGEWPLSAEIDYLNEMDRVLTDYKKSGGKVNVGTIKNEQVGLGFVGILGDKKAKALHVKAAKEGLKKATQILKSGKWDVVFLDELVSALEVGVLQEADVVKLIKVKPKKVHLILTGHNKYDKVLALCDLVTDMKMVRHPYYKGILAQRGIDY